jgi:hypothetical protein
LKQVSATIHDDKEVIGKKKAKGIIYNKILDYFSILCKKKSEEKGLQLPEIFRKRLQGKTQKAVKIYKLFKKIGVENIKYITTYTANSILELTNDKIQAIIDNFSEQKSAKLKANDEDDGDDDATQAEVDGLKKSEEIDSTHALIKADEVISVTNCNAYVTESSSSSEVSISTAPIPITYVSNSTGKSQIGEDKYDEKVPKELDNNTDNEACYYEDDEAYYYEKNRGYYYADRKYERKVSPLISPIISPVYA